VWRGRGRGSPRWKEQEGIDVGVGVPDTNPEVNVRDSVLRLARRARFCNGFPFRDDIPAPNEQRPEVRQRRLVTIVGGDRHRQAVGWNLPRKRDLAC
jgi:hypothetical protein